MYPTCGADGGRGVMGDGASQGEGTAAFAAREKALLDGGLKDG